MPPNAIPFWLEVVSLLGVIFGVTIPACLRARNERLKREQATREVKFQAAALSFEDFLSEWDEVHKELNDLCNDTWIDRFMILRAWNGHLTPKWTTAVFQFRQGKQEPVSYVHFELDDDYVYKLREVVQRGSIAFAVEDLPESAIRRVYEVEGVKHSAWFHLDSSALPNSEARAITYCSFATHHDIPIDAKTITRCRILAGRLKGMAVSIRDENSRRPGSPFAK